MSAPAPLDFAAIRKDAEANPHSILNERILALLAALDTREAEIAALRARVPTVEVTDAMVEAASKAMFGVLAHIALESRTHESWVNVAWESVAEDAREETRRVARAALHGALADRQRGEPDAE